MSRRNHSTLAPWRCRG